MPINVVPVEQTEQNEQKPPSPLAERNADQNAKQDAKQNASNTLAKITTAMRKAGNEAAIESAMRGVADMENGTVPTLTKSTPVVHSKPPSPSAVRGEGNVTELTAENALDFVADPLSDSISQCQLVQFCGSDSMNVKAARISTDRESVESGQAKLINYLLSHKHETPFEHNSFTFRIKAPVFVLRQWHRHRIGWSYNEQSRRYTSEQIEFYVPAGHEWRTQHKSNRQASSNETLDAAGGSILSALLDAHSADALRLYEAVIDSGASREQARFFLPLNLYTSMYATCNLRSLMAFCRLRDKPDAQREIAVYARSMASVARVLFPISWGAFEALENAGT